MKTLYLVRHAKSSWKDPSLADFDRPLNKRGKRDAPFMAQKMKLKGIMPDLMVSSSAKRAQETCKAFAETMGYPQKEIIFKRQIYDADEADLLAIVRKTDNDFNSLMLFGHNPELTWFANELSNGNIENVPTTGIVAIQCNTDNWQHIEFGKQNLLFFDFPKNYVSE